MCAVIRFTGVTGLDFLSFDDRQLPGPGESGNLDFRGPILVVGDRAQRPKMGHLEISMRKQIRC